MSAVPYSLVFESGSDSSGVSVAPEIEPGQIRVLQKQAGKLFRLEMIEPVEDVDYGSFEMIHLFVGSCPQRVKSGSWFEMNEPLSTCGPSIFLTLTVRNIGTEPRVFKIKLSGKAVE